MQTPDVETIAVGVDGSEASLRAFEWALEEAKRTNRSLDIIHVWHADDRGTPRAFLPPAASESRDVGFVMLRRFVRKARYYGVSATFHLIEGELPADLLEAAVGAGLLVVGSHGRSPLAADLLGSVSAACVREAPCAVVVVPAAGAGARSSCLAS